MKKITRQWVRKAEADYQVAEKLAGTSEPFHDQLCFHCQQAAEKYLKAILDECGQSVPKIHDLEPLMALLLPRFPALAACRPGLAFLTNFAVVARYPGFNTTKRQAASALRWAGRIRNVCRVILGIRPPRSRRSP